MSFCSSWLATVWLTLAALVAEADSNMVHLAYAPSTQPGELACAANYYLWLPPGVKTVRGVIVHQHGCGTGAEVGGVTAAHDLHWQALARKWDCALLGSSYRAGENDCGQWADPRRGSQARFHQALRDFAEKTAHPEIANAPWCLWGHSGGGWWSSYMLALEPERVVAAWLRSGTAFGGRTMKLDAPPPVVPEAARRVPVMANPGLKEKDDVRFSKAYAEGLAMFRDWRAQGALIGFAADPLANHDCGGTRYLAIPWLDACLAARLPKKTGAPLKSMPVKDAWLAPLENGKPQGAAKFSGPANETVWLPNDSVAKAWSEYVKTSAVTDTTPPPAPFDLQARLVSGTVELTWEACADFESGLRGFIIERDGAPLVELPEKPKGQGNHALFQGLSFHDTPSEPLVEMRFTDTTAQPGVNHRYRLIALNTAGLKSAPSKPVFAYDAPRSP